MNNFMKNQKTRAMIFSFLVLLVPTLAYGASLIPCGQPVGTANIVLNGTSFPTTDPCGFNDLMILGNTIVHFLMYDVSVPLLALGFMYAGARLVIFQDKEGEWSKAKKSFEDMAMGFGMMLGAYVLIKFILAQFLNTAGGFTLFLLQ